MKKLNKKINGYEESLESYSHCNCVCDCNPNCVCACPPEVISTAYSWTKTGADIINALNSNTYAAMQISQSSSQRRF